MSARKPLGLSWRMFGYCTKRNYGSEWYTILPTHCSHCTAFDLPWYTLALIHRGFRGFLEPPYGIPKFLTAT